MKEILLVSIAFSPNVGGIETHFDDLTVALAKRKIKAWVLTYKPITTEAKAAFHEKRGKYTEIYRIPWFGNFFYNLVGKPLYEFIYLVPGLFFALPIFLLFKGSKVETIHSHGLVSGFVSVFWGRIFGKKVVTTTHSIYHFPKFGFYRNFAVWIFGNSDKVLTLSRQSRDEVVRLGIDKNKITVFTYWVDLDKFEKIEGAKKKLGWENKFIVLFVGRLVPEKGINELLASVRMWDKKITLVVIGTGPMKQKIRAQQFKNKNLIFLGSIENRRLPLYYSSSDLVIIPSMHEEGFGRVILESLACGTPVIGSFRGAIPEAMDKTVGKLIQITPENIKNTVNYFYKNPDKLDKLSKNARKFAEVRYSEKNVDVIIGAYQ